MTSLPKTPSSAVPHTPAPATTIRAKQPSRGTSRELSCKGSMVLIPTATGAYSVPSPLPEIGTKVLVNIAQRECVIRIELDESAVLTSLLANCDPKEELIRLSYERVIVVDQLKSLAPMLINHAKESANPDGTGESDDECEYEVTTRVEHSFHFPAEFYLFQATRVKQNESTVYIQVPRIDSR
ncbi:unnamed protein product [Echinostoma caproni]|uniref:PCNA_C domain-containing protein n=1 Tax=Echinostoma caproni TaxID=27848 RepID=A0A183ABD9_9TREM|nr:unnamed protein product [Echinostoma caproni]